MIGTLEEVTHAAVVFTHACFVVFMDFIVQLMVTLRCALRALDAGMWMESMTETEVTKAIFKQLL